MYNLLISTGALALAWLLVSLVFGGIFYGVIPGLIAFGIAYVWLARRSYMAMGAAVQASQELLQPPPGFNPTNLAQAGKWKPPFDKAITVLATDAAARLNGTSYSRLIGGLKKADVRLNRKMLAQLAVVDPASFGSVVAAASR